MALTKPAFETGTGRPRNPEQFRLPLCLFGIGLGGFVDGIVLHQNLQWHHMISDTNEGPMTTVAGLEANTLADGVFHAFALFVVLVALYLALRVRRSDATAVLPSSGVVTGWLLVGWGAFNIVEGVIDHHLLTVHHVRDDVADPARMGSVVSGDLGRVAPVWSRAGPSRIVDLSRAKPRSDQYPGVRRSVRRPG